jgi:hypothetical protein
MVGIRAVLTVLLCFLASSLANAEDCKCPGRALKAYNGADDTLGWRYSASLVQQDRTDGSSLVCYEREIQSKVTTPILNVKWDVAAFRRHFVPARHGYVSCARADEHDP